MDTIQQRLNKLLIHSTHMQSYIHIISYKLHLAVNILHTEHCIKVRDGCAAKIFK